MKAKNQTKVKELIHVFNPESWEGIWLTIEAWIRQNVNLTGELNKTTGKQLLGLIKEGKRDLATLGLIQDFLYKNGQNYSTSLPFRYNDNRISNGWEFEDGINRMKGEDLYYMLSDYPDSENIVGLNDLVKQVVEEPEPEPIKLAYIIQIFMDNDMEYKCLCDVPESKRNDDNFMVAGVDSKQKRDELILTIDKQANLHYATTEMPYHEFEKLK